MTQDNSAHRAAIDMLNEIHQRMGTELVYKLKLERLAVDKIAEKHIAKAYEAGMKAAKMQAQEQRKPLTEFERMQIIGKEFPLPLVEPIIIQKIDSVCIAIEQAHGIKS